MTVFDYGVLCICLLSMLLGVWRGAIGEIIALTSWAIAFAAAYSFGRETGEILYAEHIAEAPIRLFMGGMTVIISVLALLAFIRYLMRALIRALGLGPFDRFAGLFFGLARGIVIVLILVAVGGLTKLPEKNWWREAMFSQSLEIAVLAISPWLPEEIAKRIYFR